MNRDHDFIGKQDPFITFDYRGMTYKTEVKRGEGKNPVWNQTFTLENVSPDDSIIVKCVDEDQFSNDVIGQCELKMQKLAKGG